MGFKCPFCINYTTKSQFCDITYMNMKYQINIRQVS